MTHRHRRLFVLAFRQVPATRSSNALTRFTSIMLALCCFIAVSLGWSQARDVVASSNLVVEELEPIPDSLVEEAGRYTEFRQAVLMSWHPTMREMLILTRFGDTTQVHQVRSPGADRRQLTFFRDSIFHNDDPSHTVSYDPVKGSYFIFTKDVAGNEQYQIYRSDLATGQVTLLTDGKSRNSPGLWSNAGDKIVYGSTRRTGKDVDLYVVNPLDPRTDRLLAQLQGGGWQPLDWSPDDRSILVAENVSADESYLWIFDGISGDRKLLTPKAGQRKTFYGGGKFSKAGTGVYVTTDSDSEFQQLAYIDLVSKQRNYLTRNISWDVEDFALSPDGNTIAFVTNEDGFSVLRLLGTTNGQEKRSPTIPSGVISDLKWHNNGRDLGFTFASSTSPYDVYSVDVSTGDLTRWTSSETGGLNAESFAQPKLVRWRSFDGRTIPGFLYRPRSPVRVKYPVVINIHGGPESQSRPEFRDRENYLLNELGIALFFPNVRGSTGYGKTFRALDNGFLREGSYKDIGTLIDWLRTQPDIDAERIMLTGGSYGGYMTLAGAAFYSQSIRCALAEVPPSDLVTLLEHTSSYRQDLRRVEYGDERDPKMRAFLERIAPVNNADKIRKPLFVVAGMNDPRVPVTESEQMVKAVRKNGIPVWYLMAKDEGHGFIRKPNQDFQFYATVLFIREYLLK
jgi:dipeptidyl aminopeptidase/acylaminoacyl peptidase